MDIQDKINEENARIVFFAQYFNQYVANWRYGGDALHKVYAITINHINHLHLRTVNQLTDEEKINLYHLYCGTIGYDYTQDFADFITTANHWFKNDGMAILYKYSCTSDYLRCIGVIVPFIFINETGNPVTLSVEEIIAKGWAKLNNHA